VKRAILATVLALLLAMLPAATVVAAANLVLTKAATSYTDWDGSGTLSPGDTVHYELSYENVGDTSATNVVLTDDPDETYVAAVGNISDSGAYDGDIITWNIGTLDPGDSGAVTYDATLGAASVFPSGLTLVSNTAALVSDVTVTVTDDETVGVVDPTNDPPVADANGPYSVRPTDSFQLDGSGSFDIDGDIVLYEWDFDADGTYDWSSATSGVATHAYATKGVRNPVLRVTDSWGTFSTDTAVVIVNTPPTADPNEYGTPEDTTLGIAAPGVLGNDSDEDGDPLQAVLSSSVSHGILTFNSNGSFTYVPDANFNGTDSFTYTATDGLENSSVVTVIINVYYVQDPPVANDDTATTVENVAVTIDVLANDYDVDVGDTPFVVSVSNPPNGTAAIDSAGTVTYTPDAEFNGPDSFTYRIHDGEIGDDTGLVSVTVLPNDPPVADANGPYSVSEGGSIVLDASGSSDPDGDPLTYVWDLDGNGTFETPGVNPTFTGDDGPAIVIVGLLASDGYASDSDTATVLVSNVAPTVGPITVSPNSLVEVGTPISASAAFTDPGTTDTHTAEWDWGDSATSPGTISGSGGSGTANGNHAYSIAGVYTIQVTVTDDDGGAGQAVFQFVVVYDPSAGFVTGGGWIDSPAGAYIPDPALTGKASFGFVSKYKKGASTPTGNTEFQFRAADLNLHSSSYDWLVIAGAKAIYKGVGTINGNGNYGFMLSVVDAKLTPSTDVDLFRMKIWDRDNSDAVVYDNQLGAGPYADPTTAISGGSIVVRKK
jgi:VCBS repeat-containing protein